MTCRRNPYKSKGIKLIEILYETYSSISLKVKILTTDQQTYEDNEKTFITRKTLFHLRL